MGEPFLAILDFKIKKGLQSKFSPWRVGPNHGGASYVNNLKCPF